ncbi:MAG: oxidoreductase [Candidatus Altiarchaeota archaeon]|nr:oxidoreductase [Candidatus Altiarchaeota archaeon]
MKLKAFREDWSQVAEAVRKISPGRKPKVALYMAGGCGGCDLSFIGLGERFLDITENIDVVLWPLIADFRYSRVKRMYDKTIDLCLFNGAVMNRGQMDMAQILRKKSKIITAVGSCACMGGIPGMLGLQGKGKEKSRKRVKLAEGILPLPEPCDFISPLSGVIDVDYLIPGCPPTPSMILKLFVSMLENKLPPKGSVFASGRTLCDECERARKGKSVKVFHRPYEKVFDDKVCLLDQGLLCMGPVTRAGCGSQCVSANMPCRGCLGPAEGILDMGGAYISTLASIMCGGEKTTIRKTVESIPSLGGTVYRFSLSSSILKKQRRASRN